MRTIGQVVSVKNTDSRFPAMLVLWLGRKFYWGKHGLTGSGHSGTPGLGDHFGDKSMIPENATLFSISLKSKICKMEKFFKILRDGGFRARNSIQLKIHRVWGLLHVKAYVVAQTCSLVRKFGGGCQLRCCPPHLIVVQNYNDRLKIALALLQNGTLTL
ncbi:hypothetical protein AVEN_222258-1 [Araneus ventricosus]|uniref:Uncharacterized protein n=1 Tax=Araneus ventricosus TaxID=182803 RepID=A0A4Y2Q135_ARAVE|nr:hypothetical protein AVEN_222258-1 [Araneus ventricosus]